MSPDEKYFRPTAFENFARYEDGSWWFRSRNVLIMWALHRYVPEPKDYLEIGCGTGFVLRGVHEAFPAAHVTGSEYFNEGLEFARDRVPTATFIQLDATVMEQRAEYDLIGAFDVLEHIGPDEVVLKNLATALQLGGTLAVTVPQHRWLWSKTDEYACHVRRYTRGELTRKVRAAGFEIDLVSSFVSLLFPFMLLSRVVSRRRDFDPMGEFKIPHWQSNLCESVMSAERWLLRRGVRFPFGGSLLLIAHKIPSRRGFIR
jgi:SAM-dependent methyltransferase